MGFFDELGSKITSGASAVANKTKDFAEVTKINSQITADTNAITAKYTEMGKTLYEKYAGDPSNEFASTFAEIQALEAKIVEQKSQIQKIKGVKTCPTCGAEIDASISFCGSCGAKVEVAAPAAEAAPAPATTPIADAAPAKLFCSNCGNPENAGTRFCSNCGNQMG